MDLKNILSDTNETPSDSAIRQRSSISSLTNETDVDFNGVAVPAHARARTKPKRHASVPVWAQKWVPVAQAQAQQGPGAPGAAPGPAAPPGAAPAQAGAVTINGTRRPYLDISRQISNWIYTQLSAIPPQQRQFLEIEVKFGTIKDKHTDKRINLPVNNECIIEEGFALNTTFGAGVSKQHFDALHKLLATKVKLSSAEFKSVKFDQIDKQFREGSRDQLPKFFRITTDKSTGRIVHNISKKKLSSLLIFNPNLVYDLRITIALELPSDKDPARFANSVCESERHKLRHSISHQPSYTQFDLTQVQQKVSQQNRFKTLFECELEVDTRQLLAAFDNLQHDDTSFEQIHETVLDNARILNRSL